MGQSYTCKLIKTRNQLVMKWVVSIHKSDNFHCWLMVDAY